MRFVKGRLPEEERGTKWDRVYVTSLFTFEWARTIEAIEYAIGLVKAGLTNSDPATDTRYDLQDMFGAGKVAMMIGPNSIPTYIADGGSTINYAFAPIPTNGGNASVSAGVMDRFMCFDNGHSPEKIEAIKTFFDFFYDDARYSEWVLMEGFLPATSAGGEIVAKEDPSMAPGWTSWAAVSSIPPPRPSGPTSSRASSTWSSRLCWAATCRLCWMISSLRSPDNVTITATGRAAWLGPPCIQSV